MISRSLQPSSVAHEAAHLLASLECLKHHLTSSPSRSTKHRNGTLRSSTCSSRPSGEDERWRGRATRAECCGAENRRNAEAEHNGGRRRRAEPPRFFCHPWWRPQWNLLEASCQICVTERGCLAHQQQLRWPTYGTALCMVATTASGEPARAQRACPVHPHLQVRETGRDVTYPRVARRESPRRIPPPRCCWDL